MVTINLSFKLLAMIMSGFIMVKVRCIPENPEKTVMSIILNFIVPCLVIRSLTSISLRENYQLAVQLLLSGLIYSVISFAVAHFLYVFFGKGTEAKIIRFGVFFTNFTYFGLPIVEAVFGDMGVFSFTIFTLPIRILYYVTPAYLLGERENEASVLNKITAFFTPPVCAVLVGIILSAFEICVPEILMQVMSTVSQCCTPLGMLLCGFVLGKFPVKELLRFKYLRLPVIRNFLFPTVTLFVLRMLRIPGMVAQMVFLYSCLPVGSFLIVYAVNYVTDEKALKEASAALLISTLLAVVTVPVWLNICAL